MKLQQLKYLCEIVKQNLNLTKAANALHTSQPGVSRQIQLLEQELGIEIFTRHGKRITHITQPGAAILEIAQKMLRDADNLKKIGQEFNDKESGTLIIATTHTQARYVLPPTIKRFIKRYPRIRLSLRQGSPTEISSWVSSGEADLAIATEAIELFDELIMLPCYEWNRSVIVPPQHPLLEIEELTLEALAQYAIVTYDFAFTGRSKINQAFAAKGLKPNVVLTALDADVIKTYVEIGLGVGILAKMAFDTERDTGLRVIDAAHLFEPSTTRIGIRRDSYIRHYIYDFIEMFAAHLDMDTVKGLLENPERLLSSVVSHK
ncbi:HTH-type transcriptional regulator CysB [Nitrosomonas stercoris]|uniref:HTH-type transcriptional regulator CysB n=1 Tax=Nitrosomonas stercoris TaxID=1444684 RepID=A0A4Y1YRN9_9PROT|nr:HTH-type transcriptional regulator CysB [Nitrosomonas stercoris]